MRGEAFKKAGWRLVRVMALWGKRYKKPLCLVSELKPDWWLIALICRRYPIEAKFCEYKSSGWHWEQG